MNAVNRTAPDRRAPGIAGSRRARHRLRLPAALALAAVALGGIGTYRKGWIALRNLTLNINALMTIAVTGAMLIGQWPEAAMVVVLFALAERIEAASLDRARNAIRGLMAMTPEEATVNMQPEVGKGVQL